MTGYLVCSAVVTQHRSINIIYCVLKADCQLSVGKSVVMAAMRRTECELFDTHN